MILILTILATICAALCALCVFALILMHKGNWGKAFYGVLLYGILPIVMLWVLYARTP